MGLKDLFSGKPPKPATEHVGGCAVHDMHGPARSTPKAATKDVRQHGKRIHGSETFPGGYIERRK